MRAIRIGISGWRYPGWRGVFYPRGLRQADELSFAARHFNSIEINGSFYSLQRPSLYAAWRASSPRDFVFAVKGGRFITHMKKLRGVELPLANFFASGVLRLEEKLGPILWQFPERLGFDERFERFFEMLPRDTTEASKLARRHDRGTIDRAAVGVGRKRPLRHAVEVRSTSFATPEFVSLLRRYEIALVVADTASRWPYFEDVTADFVYVRLHGDQELYKSGYSPRAISHWAERVRAWSAGREPSDAVKVSEDSPPARAERDVYVYFDNDIKVRAPFDAIALARALGLPQADRDATPARRARRGSRA